MKIGILGAAGRMGQMIAREAFSRQHGVDIGAVVEHAQSWALGRDIGEITGSGTAGFIITPDAAAAVKTCEVLSDCKTPASTAEITSTAASSSSSVIPAFLASARRRSTQGSHSRIIATASPMSIFSRSLRHSTAWASL